MYQAFEDYVNKFNLNDYWINYKYEHSLRVATLCLEFAKVLNLSKKDTELIEQIGLLHDVGRFIQLQKYQDFGDHKTIDHGNAGVRYLFEENHIQNFNIPEENYEIIKIAIKNHNKMKVADNIQDRPLFFSKLIRDIDKIEILKDVINDTIPLKKCNEPISAEVDYNFKYTKLVDKSDAKNKNDEALIELGFIFDLNFNISFKYLRENNLVKKLEKVYDNPIFNEYFIIINEFVDNKLKEEQLC